MNMQNLAQENGSNVMTVVQLSHQIKSTMENNFAHVKVKGEIGSSTIHSSGHIYFNIKDADSSIDCICWRGLASNLNHDLFKQGSEVTINGKVTTYAGRSKYQLIISSIALTGKGDLLQQLQIIKKQLSQEGVFLPSNKHTMPLLPKKIAIITSSTGSVIHDMLHRISDRFPIHVVIAPAKMQGDSCSAEIIKNIRYFEQLKQITDETNHVPDVIIIARGGGSVEDLWPFNNPDLARCVAKCSIPIISAIGHETDTTILDYAACKRAPTPTAAAEMVVPVLEEVLIGLNNKLQNLQRNLLSSIAPYNEKLRFYGINFTKFPDKIELKQQFLDESILQLKQNLQKHVQISHLKIIQFPKTISKRIEYILQTYGNQLNYKISLLNSYSHLNVLKRGYSLIRKQNKIVNSIKNIKNHEKINITMHDGELGAVVDSKSSN